MLNRILMRCALDFPKRRIDLLQGEVAGGGVNLAMSGNIDFSSGEPRMSGGMVGTPMKGTLAKRIWPMFVASKVRNWVLENIQGGDVTRVEIAANAPMPTLKEGGPPIPDDGLSVEVDIVNATIRPVDGLPAIKRRRSHDPDQGTQCGRQCRPRHRRTGIRTQAHREQRRVRGAGHAIRNRRRRARGSRSRARSPPSPSSWRSIA